MNSTALWKERFRQFLKEVRTYSKYVFNDHLKFIFVFIIGAGAYYYQWLQTLTTSFPTALVMAVLIGLVLTAGSIQTLLKEADLVYLLPVEEKLKPYFTKAFLFTFMIQLYIIAIVAAALCSVILPTNEANRSWLHMDRTRICHCKSVEFICSVGKVILTDQNIQRADWFIRFILNGLFVYFLVERTSVLFIGGIVLLMVLYLAIIHQMVKGKPLNWEYLISEEGKKMMLLYRIANMFVDVPALKERVARRNG